MCVLESWFWEYLAVDNAHILFLKGMFILSFYVKAVSEGEL